MKRFTVIILFLSAVIFLPGCGLLDSLKEKIGQSEQNGLLNDLFGNLTESGFKEKGVSSEWKSFVNEVSGLSFEYPANWSVEESKDEEKTEYKLFSLSGDAQEEKMSVEVFKGTALDVLLSQTQSATDTADNKISLSVIKGENFPAGNLLALEDGHDTVYFFQQGSDTYKIKTDQTSGNEILEKILKSFSLNQSSSSEASACLAGESCVLSNETKQSENANNDGGWVKFCGQGVNFLQAPNTDLYVYAVSGSCGGGFLYEVEGVDGPIYGLKITDSLGRGSLADYLEKINSGQELMFLKVEDKTAWWLQDLNGVRFVFSLDFDSDNKVEDLKAIAYKGDKRIELSSELGGLKQNYNQVFSFLNKSSSANAPDLLKILMETIDSLSFVSC